MRVALPDQSGCSELTPECFHEEPSATPESTPAHPLTSKAGLTRQTRAPSKKDTPQKGLPLFAALGVPLKSTNPKWSELPETNKFLRHTSCPYPEMDKTSCSNSAAYFFNLEISTHISTHVGVSQSSVPPKKSCLPSPLRLNEAPPQNR